MSKIESTNKVREYKETVDEYQTLFIENHPRHDNKVIFTIDGESYVFVAEHVIKAIKNALNCH